MNIKKPVVWLIAGTSEGRNLIKKLAEAEITLIVSVATEYGAQLIEPQANLTVLPGRLDEVGMEHLLDKYQPVLVVDATHPYAVVVTETIQKACQVKKCQYIRLVRPSSQLDDCIIVSSYIEAVDYLEKTKGKIFLATGSNTLGTFAKLTDFQERLIARILPMRESLHKALELGYKPQHIICMQGPFSQEINYAMFNNFEVDFVVTKESGSSGGFMEKQKAAQQAGAKLLVIGRQEDGLGNDFEHVLKIILALESNVSKKRG